MSLKHVNDVAKGLQLAAMIVIIMLLGGILAESYSNSLACDPPIEVSR